MNNVLKILLLSAFLILSLSQISHAQFFNPDLKTAQKAYKNEDYQTAFKHWKALENYNEQKAYLGLGRLYARGLGVETDHKKALQYFMKAAKQNNEKAQYEIAYAYEKGRGVEKNQDKAQQWYAISAAQGYKRAENRLEKLNESYIASSIRQKSKNNYKIRSILRSQLVVEDNLSLGESNDSSSALISQGQITATYDPIKDIRLKVQARAVGTIGSASSNDDNFENMTDSNFAEIRQASFKKQNLFDITPLSVEIGRQRFRETRGNWWNDDLDAIKLIYDTTLSSAFLALGQNFSKYRVGSDDNLERDEKNRLRFLGELSYNYKPNHLAQIRFLYENDYSNTPAVNDFISTTDRDEIDHNLLWVGLRGEGKISSFSNAIISNLKYHTDLMGVVGTEDSITTSFATAATRRVTSQDERNVAGLAFDGRLEAQLNHQYSPTFILGYAYGSGDDGNGTNNAFRQTGLESNTSLFPNDRVASSLRQYGEVLRPELSNIHILNLGLNFPLFNQGDLNLHYYSYWRDNNDTGLLSNGLDQNLSNSSSHIGQSLDISANYPLDQIFKSQLPQIRSSLLRLKFGSFYSGQAYGTNENELALKTTAEVSIKF